ncbi:hypothetical protein, partial [Bacillus safensis]|uniref:hypothetical protein n=2 Tax=Bacillus TaxID=1386 RepID=UPI0022808D09
MNNNYDSYRQQGMRVFQHYQPAGAGTEWINKNVDILMNNGTCFGNVRFISVDMIASPAGLPATPNDFLWTFDQYPPGGGAPIRRRVSPIDVAQINQPGTLCQTSGGHGGG